MPRKARSNHMLLTDVELDVIRPLWDRKQASASQIQMELVREGKETAYTTVKVLLDKMVRTGICKSREVKGRYVYEPVMSRERIAKEWYKHIRRMIFGK